MRADELQKILDRRPFEPVRLHLSSGEHVDIKHPELAFVTRSLVVVGLGGSGRVADYVVHYNLIHIVKIEPLDGQEPTTTTRPRPK